MSSDDLFFIRSSSLMALGTIFSRITGLIRNLLIVAVLGTAILGDTFSVANTMPNILYNLLVGGALTAIFIPQIIRASRGEDGGSLFISRLFTATSSVLLLIVIAALLASPLLVKIYAPTFTGREYEITLTFMRYCIPQIFFLGLFSILGQIANAKGKFGPMMWAPILNNLVVIFIFSSFLLTQSNITVANISDRQIQLLGMGTTLGIILQSLVLIPVLKAAKVSLSLRFDWRGAGLGHSLKLASWTFLFVLISQVGFLFTVTLATRTASKGLLENIGYGLGYTPYANAYLIFLLPHSIITISVVTALLPKLSAFVLDNKYSEMKTGIVKAIKLVGIATVPSAIFFLLFGEEISRVLFFGIPTVDAEFIGKVLVAFSLAVIPLSLNLIAVRGLNAFENARSQVLSNLVINLVAVVLSLLSYLVLPIEWITVGLAGSFSLSYWIGTSLTYRLLAKQLGSISISNYFGFYIKLLLISLTVCLPLKFIASRLTVEKIPGGNISLLLGVLLLASAGYLFLARFFKIDEIKELGQTLKLLRRK